MMLTGLLRSCVERWRRYCPLELNEGLQHELHKRAYDRLMISLLLFWYEKGQLMLPFSKRISGIAIRHGDDGQLSSQEGQGCPARGDELVAFFVSHGRRA